MWASLWLVTHKCDRISNSWMYVLGTCGGHVSGPCSFAIPGEPIDVPMLWDPVPRHSSASPHRARTG